MRTVSLVLLGLFGWALLAATPVSARDRVRFKGYSPGTIVIKTSQRRLYYVVSDGKAIRYPVGVGRAGMRWQGTTFISGMHIKPAWSPPESIKRENPRIPDVIPAGSSRNPMGAAAMTLAGGEYAIHGTNNPGSIGGFVSHGCIRMYNSDIMDLYNRVGFGTKVVVLH
jgi:lipoprotein-anchoring transpeptidase ErfK/SrfK